MRARSHSGFTLIELSIVLVIIGLLVGGVLVGRDLIRSAGLRSIIQDVEQYNTAVNAFRLEYNCLPGDCSGATRYFGTDSLGCPSGGGTTGTCDGNGNGFFDGLPVMAEGLRAWQQLGMASLIRGGPFSGVGADALVGTNVPSSRIGRVGYVFYTWLVDNAIIVGAEYSNALESGFLTGQEAQHIDSKMDDGVANSGMVLGLDGHGAIGHTNCVDDSNVYVMVSSDRHCRLMILRKR